MIRDNDAPNGDSSVPSQIYAKDMTIRQDFAARIAAGLAASVPGTMPEGYTYKTWVPGVANTACDLADALIEELNKREIERRELKAKEEEAA
jgi:hypothetical protein